MCFFLKNLYWFYSFLGEENSIFNNTTLQFHRYVIRSKRIFIWLFDLENCSESSIKILLREIQLENIIFSLNYSLFQSNEFEEIKQKMISLISLEEFETARIYMVVNKDYTGGRQGTFF